MNLLRCKVDVEGFGFSKHRQDIDIRRVYITMDAWQDNWSKWKVCNEKIHKRADSVHNLKVSRTCLARGNIFENDGYF